MMAIKLADTTYTSVVNEVFCYSKATKADFDAQNAPDEGGLQEGEAASIVHCVIYGQNEAVNQYTLRTAEDYAAFK